jgi:hypothetical protein
MSVKAVRTAITEILLAESDLTDLLDGLGGIGVFFENAPQKAGYPYVLLHKQSGGPEYTFGDWHDSEVWIVKGVDRAAGADTVDDIDVQLRQILQDAPLNIAGYDTLWFRRESDISYTETEVGAVIHHRGCQWRLEMEPA